MPYYHVDDAQSINSNLDWLVINYLCEPVDNDKYQVIAVPLLIHQNWETYDKI